ncbi:hypothetical protein NHX12_003949 [Muraenolepis orangiensis]|uniref:Protein odr-4 homolog n=1 Tax=Muraenolepis orangiensis TaxID=630683 RepID=A0A9Q0IBQ7_9TELE|nr:hypothetical protein NHX12_003949 [Muraenolepis orangiensis]
MGRGYMVEEAVERYLSSLCSSSPVTGLILGQSSAQRDFVVMATRTPHREESSGTDRLDQEWITEHARQVSRMLPGGLSVLGVFFINEAEAKDTLITLRQLVVAVERSISRDVRWLRGDEDEDDKDDITERVILHVNSTTRKTFCRTLDVRDPKSTAKPADWRYQSGRTEALVPADQERNLPPGREKSPRRHRNHSWTHGELPTPPYHHLTTTLPPPSHHLNTVTPPSRHRNATATPSSHHRNATATPPPRHRHATATPPPRHRHATATPPPRHRHATLLKRDLVSTVAFSDEGVGEVLDRLKENLDLDATQEDLDTTQEALDTTQEALDTTQEALDTTQEDHAEIQPSQTETHLEAAEAPQKKNNYTGVAMATVVALLAAAAWLLYLETIKH